MEISSFVVVTHRVFMPGYSKTSLPLWIINKICAKVLDWFHLVNIWSRYLLFQLLFVSRVKVRQIYLNATSLSHLKNLRLAFSACKFICKVIEIIFIPTFMGLWKFWILFKLLDRIPMPCLVESSDCVSKLSQLNCRIRLSALAETTQPPLAWQYRYFSR